MSVSFSTLREMIGGKIFAVAFTKRTTGEYRVITGRFGVQAHLKGGAPGGKNAFDPASKGLFCLYDMGSEGKPPGYKMIPLDGIDYVTFAGEKYHYKDGAFVPDGEYSL